MKRERERERERENRVYEGRKRRELSALWPSLLHLPYLSEGGGGHVSL